MGWALYVHKAYVPRASSSITSVFRLYVFFFRLCMKSNPCSPPSASSAQRARGSGAGNVRPGGRHSPNILQCESTTPASIRPELFK